MFSELENILICFYWCLRMVEFRICCKPENVIATCAIGDCSGAAAFVHSLTFYCDFYSLKIHTAVKASNLKKLKVILICKAS